MERKFEKDDRACTPKATDEPPEIAGSCTAHNTGKFVPVVLEVAKDGQQHMKVELPPFEPERDQTEWQVDMAMPDGEPWKVNVYFEDGVAVRAELPNHQTVNITKTGGTCVFKFVRIGEHEQNQLRRVLLDNYRCCCDDSRDDAGACKWFTQDQQRNGETCPHLKKTADVNGIGSCVSTTVGTFAGTFSNKWQKLSHSRRRDSQKHKCQITSAKSAYFTGPKCADVHNF